MYNILYMIRKTARIFLVLFVFGILIFAAGCIEMPTVAPKVVENGDTIGVYYTLTLDDGTVRESNVGKSPLVFEVGSGKMISGFDKAVIGMEVDETKVVTLTPAEGYGEYDSNPENMVGLPIALVQSYTDEPIVPGLKVEMNLFTGGSMICEVVEVDEESGMVGLLVNHPLAGQNLTFEITVDSISSPK